MQRLATFDISRRFENPCLRLLAQTGFGVACALKMVIMRTALDFWLPGAGPFALVYPTVLIATLFGRWRAGIVAWLLCVAWTWYFVMPFPSSFSVSTQLEFARIAVNASSALLVLVLAEFFRIAAKEAIEDRAEEIGRRTIAMSELEHRTKNNFALVASLLELQKRKETDPQVTAALEVASSRIHSFARAYANLAQSQGEGETVRMKPYIDEVVRRFSEGAFYEGIEVRIEANDSVLPRETAVAIGLFTNEALTNCAKYAFPDGRTGRVNVTFFGDAESWELIVSDNGVGTGNGFESSGLGWRLFAAFAKQAQASYELHATDAGRHLRLAST